jgi:hypothetical protein
MVGALLHLMTGRMKSPITRENGGGEHHLSAMQVRIHKEARPEVAYMERLMSQTQAK